MIPEVKDRNVQFPNRYRLVKVDTGEEVGVYDFVEEAGTVHEEGTVVNAELLNKYRDGISEINAIYRFSESSVSSSFSGTTELYKEDLVSEGEPRVGDSVIFPDNKSLVLYIGTITHVNDITYTVSNITYIESCWKPSGTWISGVTANYPEVYNHNNGTYVCLGRDIKTAPVEGKEWFCISKPNGGGGGGTAEAIPVEEIQALFE